MSDDLHYFSTQQLDIIDQKIHTLLNRRQKIREPKYVYLDNADLLKLLSISRKTAENWRNQGKIRFSRINNKLFYRLSDVIEMMENHVTHKSKINSKNQ